MRGWLVEYALDRGSSYCLSVRLASNNRQGVVAHTLYHDKTRSSGSLATLFLNWKLRSKVF